ncbi:Hypothetical protein (plasmid) [Pseudomonas putida]|nr:hypothetical protein [Pseudomonas sp.]QDQ70338.1 hypothetical protein pJBCL41_00597 [Pseudomonas sp.]QIZ22359.1 Hypothetical protein [Pseudomonas putida]
MWQYSRVDHLRPQAVCFFCNRPLRSLKGIVITDGTLEANAGPNCAKRMLGPPEERLLDVSRLALLVVSDSDFDTDSPTLDAAAASTPQLVSVSQAALPNRGPLPPLDRLIQYLRLRYECMGEFSHHRSSLLNDAYDAFTLHGELSEEQRKRVAGTIRNAAELNLIFSEANVKRCIGLNHWLHEAVAHTHSDRRGFLEAMLRKLHSQWFLTAGQIAAVNKWGKQLRKRVHTFPHLDTEAFVGVRLPSFMQSKSKGT